jgi:hypothetical protein
LVAISYEAFPGRIQNRQMALFSCVYDNIHHYLTSITYIFKKKNYLSLLPDQKYLFCGKMYFSYFKRHFSGTTISEQAFSYFLT